MNLHLSQINIFTDTWYTPYYSGCSSAQRVTLLSGFSPAASWPQRLSGSVCSSHGDAVHLWAEVIKVYARARIALQTLYLAQKMLFSFETGPIFLYYVIYHKIPYFQLCYREKMIYHIFILITAKILWGQSSSHATGRSCEVHHPFLSHLGLSAFIYCYVYNAHVCMHAHPFLSWITFSLYLAHSSYLFLPV